MGNSYRGRSMHNMTYFKWFPCPLFYILKDWTFCYLRTLALCTLTGNCGRPRSAGSSKATSSSPATQKCHYRDGECLRRIPWVQQVWLTGRRTEWRTVEVPINSNGIVVCNVFKPNNNLAFRYDLCVKDTCGCNVGGDCECLCTAVSAYAEACSQAGIHINWRSQGLCGECH